MKDHFDQGAPRVCGMGGASEPNNLPAPECQENDQSVKLVSLDRFRTHVQTVHAIGDVLVNAEAI